MAEDYAKGQDGPQLRERWKAVSTTYQSNERRVLTLIANVSPMGGRRNFSARTGSLLIHTPSLTFNRDHITNSDEPDDVVQWRQASELQ